MEKINKAWFEGDKDAYYGAIAEKEWLERNNLIDYK